MPSAALAFLFGVLFIHTQASLPSPTWALLAVPAVLAARRWPLFWLLIWLVAGAAWTGARAAWVLADELPTALEGRDLRITGRVADIPRSLDRGQRFEFRVDGAERDGRPVIIPRHIELTSYRPQGEWRVGDSWSLTVRLKRPHGMQNPGGFDYEAHTFQRRVRALGYVRDQPEPEALTGIPNRDALGRFRQQLSAAIPAALAADKQPYAGMLTAFANGDQRGVSDPQWQVLTDTGTVHLVAVSGLHISLVAGIAFWLFRGLWSRIPPLVLRLAAPRAAAVAAVAAAAAYAALAGFSIPTQRALVMVAAAMTGLILARQPRPSALLAAALLAVLILDPLAVLAAGFWLSFGAVAVILYAVQGRRAGGLRAYEWLRLQGVVALGLLPATLLLFQRASGVGPVANLVAIPAVEFVTVPLTLLGVLAHSLWLPALAGWIWNLATWPLTLLWPLLETLAGWPGAQWSQAAPPLWAIACAVAGLAWLLAPRGWPARWVGAVWLLPLFLLRPPAPALGEAWISLLDVGQGLAVVVRTAHHTLVYDTGARWSRRFDAGRAVILPYLRSQHVSALDTLIVSHGDNDHAGGADSLRAGMPIGRLLTSVPERWPQAQACLAGDRWSWDGVGFSILHPGPDPPAGNNGSCVLRVTTATGSALLPGDIAAAAERQLLAGGGGALTADILIAPHHGSRTSSTEAFLDAVQPRWVLYAVGYRNRYHHPSAEVAARYARRGTHALRSDDAGCIELRLGAGGVTASQYRQTAARYWRARP